MRGQRRQAVLDRAQVLVYENELESLSGASRSAVQLFTRTAQEVIFKRGEGKLTMALDTLSIWKSWAHKPVRSSDVITRSLDVRILGAPTNVFMFKDARTYRGVVIVAGPCP